MLHAVTLSLIVFSDFVFAGRRGKRNIFSVFVIPVRDKEAGIKVEGV